MDCESSSMKRKLEEEADSSLISKKPHNDSDISRIKAVAESTKIGEELNDSDLVSDVMSFQQLSENDDSYDEADDTRVEKLVTICNAIESDSKTWKEDIALLRRELKAKEDECTLYNIEKEEF